MRIPPMSTAAHRPHAAATGAATVTGVFDRSLQLVATVWVGVMAGFFWAFTAVVMPGIDADETAPLVAMEAMQGINDVVRSAQFAVFFFGAPLLCLALAARAALRRDSLWRLAEAAGAILYVLGVFVVTFARNVPFNDDLAALDAADPANGPTMAIWIEDWTAWNDVRTIAGLLAFALLAASLVFGQGRRAGADG